jgi:hypothetical protein
MKPGPMNEVYLTTFRRILWKKPGGLPGRPPRAPSGPIPSAHFIERDHFDDGTVSSDDVGGVVLGAVAVRTTATGCSSALHSGAPTSVRRAGADGGWLCASPMASVLDIWGLRHAVSVEEG